MIKSRNEFTEKEKIYFQLTEMTSTAKELNNTKKKDDAQAQDELE